MILANFTPDSVTWQHIGVVGTLKSNETKEFDEARGNHICTAFGRKGIIQMQYKDDEREKRVEAMALWTEFWEDQITRFNQHNEDQKEKGNRYEKPPKDLLKRAHELGLELLQPWKIKTEFTEIAELKKNKEEQATSILALTEQVAKLTSMLEDSMTPQNGDGPKRGRPPKT